MLCLRIFLQIMLIATFPTGDAIYRGQSVSLAEQSEFSYMVAIVDSTHVMKSYCSGAIIDATHILTAAHCVFYSLKQKITIIAGVVDRESIYSKRSSVARIHVPKEFRDHGHICGTLDYIREWVRDAWQHIKDERDYCWIQNDIAVLKLTNALPFGDHIKAVNLPDSDSLPHCQLCKFSGWGRTEKDKPSSQHLYWTYFMIVETANTGMISSSEILAGDPMLETCPLLGDSGAPLVFNNTVYGVHSAGRDDPYFPALFSKVFVHINFIRKALQN